MSRTDSEIEIFALSRGLMVALAGLIITSEIAGAFQAVNSGSPPVVTEQHSVDFNREIAPILARSCLRCHGGGQDAVDDLLTSPQRARQGGDSGKDLLALPIETNEIVRRIRAIEPGDRMPLSGPPLSEAEIQAIERWILAGAAWPVRDEEANAPQGPWYSRWSIQFFRWYDANQGDRLIPCAIALAAVAVLALLQLRARRRAKSRAEITNSRTIGTREWGRLSWSTLLNLLLLVVIWAGWTQWIFLEDRNRGLQIELLRLKPPGQAVGRFAPRIRPPHPPRMGGEYFRGNDERNPGLFNGGFYRTCTFKLELRNETGQRLDWNDPWPNLGQIHLEIHQSPFATKALFENQMMVRGGLWDGDPWVAEWRGDQREVPVRPMPGREDAWEADFPIPVQNAVDDTPLAGTVYYYRDLPKVGEVNKGEVHYQIGYKLIKTAGKIDPRSELWMESVYNVPKIDFPEIGKITPAEWFSAVPIPEIIGGNTSDPDLLGIPEHLNRQAPK